MKTTFWRCSVGMLLAMGTLVMSGLLPGAAGAAEAGTAVVTGLRGLAQHAPAGGNYQVLKVGTVVRAGDLVQTASGSALDLDFGGAIGPVRLLQSTTVSVASSGASGVTLDLRGGEVLGRLKALPAGTKFQVEVPTGIAGVLEGGFRLSARGYFVKVDGSALFVEVRPDADPVVHDLKSGEAQYFTPVDRAVRTAPAALVEEVNKQLKAKLPKR